MQWDKLKMWFGFCKNEELSISNTTIDISGDYLFKGKTIAIPHKYIFMTAYLYMIIPIAIFFLTWLKYYVGIFACAILFFGLRNVFRSHLQCDRKFLILPLKHIFVILIIISIWTYSSSYFFYQTWDMHARNAVLRDLIDYPWPVIYKENNCALDYYFMHWLIPALMGKVFGFTISNVILWAVNSIGIFIVFLCLCLYVSPQKTSSLYIILLIFIGWQGLNDIGYAWIDILQQGSYGLSSGFGWPDMYHGYGYQYTPNDGLLAWVHNQTIVPWIVISLFMILPKIENYAFLGLCALPYGPIPFVGIFVFLIVDFMGRIWTGGFLKAIRECFSVQNICAILSVFPVFALFFKANVAANHVGFYNVTNAFDMHHIVFLIVFYLLEFGIYCILIRKDYNHSLMFWVVIASLIVIPHIQVGGGRDFCMRASIPALFVLMVLVIKFILKHESEGLRPAMTVLVICLTISGYGTAKDWMARVKAVYANDWNPVVADDFITFSNKPADFFYCPGYLVPNYNETVFFKYLAKLSPIQRTTINLKSSEDLLKIETISDIDTYLDYLAGKDCTIYIATQDIQGYSLRQDTVDRMKALGFDRELDALMQSGFLSFIGIVDNGKIVTEQIGDNEHITYSNKVSGYPVIMESATLNTGNLSVINIKGWDYSVKGRGLNIVVRDNMTGCVVDSVCFDTYTDEMTCLRLQ